MQLDARQMRFTDRFWATDPEEAQRVERVLASARAFLSTTAFVAIWLDPTEPSRYASLAYGLLVVYVLHSLLILTVVRLHRESTAAFRLSVHVLDILWPALISYFTAGPNSPFFIFNVFVLLAAAYRWSFHETMATAAAAIVLFFSQPALMAWGPRAIRSSLESELEFELNRFIMRGLYLLIMAYLLGYLGEQEEWQRAEISHVARIIGKVQAERGLRGALRSVFEEILPIFGTTRALLALREASTERAFLWEARRPVGEGDVILASSELDPALPAAYLFAPPGQAWHALRRESRGGDEPLDVFAVDEKGRRRVLARTLPEALLKAHEFRSLLGVSLAYGDEWSGNFLIFEPECRLTREQAVEFLQKLSQQVGPAIYSVFLMRRLRSRIGAVERARVARELHDGVIQSLIGLEMQVDVVRRQADASGAPSAKELARIQQLLRREVANLRELMQQMRPVDVGPRQLLDYLASLVDRFRSDTGISAKFVSTLDEPSLPPRVCNEVGRIVQEALVNVRKHSRARNVLVSFDAREGHWRLVVDDDGRGFDFSGRCAQSELDAARKGPVVIKERVRSIGGELTIESVPGRGARLEVLIPRKSHG